MDTRSQILDILTQDARTRAADIAAMIGIPEAEVVEHIKALEDENIIRGYKAIVDTNLTKSDRCTCLIEVSVQPERDRGFDAVAERIVKFPEVRSVYLLSGGYDLLVIIEGHTMNEIAEFVIQKLSTQGNVKATTTHFLLKKYKELGVSLMQESGPKRMPVTP